MGLGIGRFGATGLDCGVNGILASNGILRMGFFEWDSTNGMLRMGFYAKFFVQRWEVGDFGVSCHARVLGRLERSWQRLRGQACMPRTTYDNMLCD